MLKLWDYKFQQAKPLKHLPRTPGRHQLKSIEARAKLFLTVNFAPSTHVVTGFLQQHSHQKQRVSLFPVRSDRAAKLSSPEKSELPALMRHVSTTVVRTLAEQRHVSLEEYLTTLLLWKG